MLPKEEPIIPEFLFNEKITLFVKIPFCEKNEKSIPNFIKTFDSFTNFKYKLNIIWITKKLRSLFPLKDRVSHSSKGVYLGTCSCGLKYIGETVRNFSTRWKEHEDLTKDSEVARHLKYNSEHNITWSILMKGLANTKLRKIFEAFFIAKTRPALNAQVQHYYLSLFRNGIT